MLQLSILKKRRAMRKEIRETEKIPSNAKKLAALIVGHANLGALLDESESEDVARTE